MNEKKEGFWREEYSLDSELKWNLYVEAKERMNGFEKISLVTNTEEQKIEFILCMESWLNSELDKAKKEGYEIGLAEGCQKTLKDDYEKQQKVVKKGTVKGKEGRKPSLSVEQVEQCRVWRKQGRSLRWIGKELKVSHQTIKNVLKM